MQAGSSWESPPFLQKRLAIVLHLPFHQQAADKLWGNLLSGVGEEYSGAMNYLHASATNLANLPFAFTHLLVESLERYMVVLLEQFTRILYSCSGETPSSEILASKL